MAARAGGYGRFNEKLDLRVERGADGLQYREPPGNGADEGSALIVPDACQKASAVKTPNTMIGSRANVAMVGGRRYWSLGEG